MRTYIIKRDQHKTIALKKPGEYCVVLAETGAQAEVSGAFMVAGSDSKIVNVLIHHQAPNTKATTTIKGVADGKGFIKLVGKIMIDKNCGNSNSFLTERVLLLSDEARAQAVPELEIKTDDVKCSHAASVSKIPEVQLFYLMSRGLSRQEAKTLVVEGFLGKVR
jgi:Fe-S cluster assembly protein SufD